MLKEVHHFLFIYTLHYFKIQSNLTQQADSSEYESPEIHHARLNLKKESIIWLKTRVDKNVSKKNIILFFI